MRQLEETLYLLAGQDPPVDTAVLIDRIEQDLTEEGVPAVAIDGSRIMHAQAKPSEKTLRRPTRRRWVFAAALIATAMAIGTSGWLFGGDNPEDVVSAPVFDMQTDSFCEWFTADDMNEILATAQQRAETAYVLDEFTLALGGCDRTSWWTTRRSRSLSGSESLSVAVRIESVNSRVEGNFDSFRVNPDAFVGHHLLDDGVSYQNRTYQFGWREGLDGYLRVDGHEDEILYFGISFDDHDGVTEMTPEYEELGLAVVNELLQRMNWIDAAQGG